MLAVALLAPWLLVLCFLYWWFPRSLRRTPARRVFDTACIVLALVAAIGAALLAQHGQPPAARDALGRRAGDIWPEVLAALYAYGAFSLVLLAAVIMRALLWRKRAP